MSYATTLLLTLALLAGCSVSQTVKVDDTAYSFGQRLPVYEQCGLDAGLGALRGVMLAKSLEGQPTEQAVQTGLEKVLGSSIPTKAASSCGLAVRLAQAAIKAGLAGK